jgi:dienelactone hydrolase
VTQAARGSRLIAAGGAAAGCLAVIVLAAACVGHPQALSAKPGPREVRSQPAASPGSPSGRGVPARAVAAVGTADAYQVGEQQLTFAEPAHTGPAGQYLTGRTLVVDIRYPRAQRSGGGRPARGPFPLIMFAPGFMQCDGPYSDLLDAWASAGYVVAAVNFPRTDCRVGAAAYEPDLVNQPWDMSYALSRLLELSAQPGALLSGLVDSRQIAAAGQSDGGDTVAALAANSCCADHRLAAVAVLSGQEWPPMPGRYFPGGAPPMLFVQGSADTVNLPWTSVQMYAADQAHARYYLDLFGATHTIPYWGTNAVEQIVAAVTLAFFNRYVLGHTGALGTMARDGNVGGAAILVSGGRLPPS